MSWRIRELSSNHWTDATYYYNCFTAIIQDNLSQPAPAAKDWRMFMKQSFTDHMPLLVWIGEKTLHFFSAVLPAPYQYL